MFERFTVAARDVVVGAQHHARRLGHCYIGCEHLLLAVANSSSRVTSAFDAAGASPAALDRSLADVLGHPAGGPDDRSALASLGIDLDEVRRVVESTFGTGSLDLAAQGNGKRGLRRWLGRRRCETPPGRALGASPVHTSGEAMPRVVAS